MALLDRDSFDYYTSLTDRYTLYTAGGTPAISAGNGRHSSASLRRNNLRSGAFRTLPSSYGTLIMGASVKATDPGAVGTYIPIFSFINAGSTVCTLAIRQADQAILVLRGKVNGGSILGSAGTYTWGTTIYIEWKVLFSTTVGTVEVRINGNSTAALALTGQNTGGSTANQYAFGEEGSGSVAASQAITIDNDDCYVCDTSGSVNNDFLGDRRVDVLLPDGAGASAVWTRGGTDSGSDQGQVNEVPADGDTTYLASSTAGEKTLLTVGDMPIVAGTVNAVSVITRARKDDAGTRIIKSKVKSGATEGNGANNALGTSYAYAADNFETNPDTAAAWTIAEVNGMQIGVETVS